MLKAFVQFDSGVKFEEEFLVEFYVFLFTCAPSAELPSDVSTNNL